MSQAIYQKNHQILHQLMQERGIESLSELSHHCGVSELQLIRLQYGLLPRMEVATLLKISAGLQIPVTELLTRFASDIPLLEGEIGITQSSDGYALATLKQEYQRLQEKLEQQQENLQQEFERSILEALESWLLQWPTAAAVAKRNPQLPAIKLLPLVKPLVDLLQKWGVQPIASVGEELPYDPQCHQLMEGTATPGDLVKVRYIGYRQGEKLLYRAKVSPVIRSGDD